MPNRSGSSALGNPEQDWRSADGSTSPYRWNGSDERRREGGAPAAGQAPERTVSPPIDRPITAGPGQRSITVAQGDTLYGLSRRHGVDLKALIAANSLKSAELRPGQVLVLP